MNKEIETFLHEAKHILSLSPKTIATVREIAENSVRYYGAGKEDRKTIRELQVLENRWYASLRAGKPDYSVYEDPIYIGDLISCWLVYSSKYLKFISQETKGHRSVLSSLYGVRRVVDLGCGLGYTTARLTELFPNAEVFATNVEGAPQTEFARHLGRTVGFEIITGDLREIGPVDLVFASEYFEHFISPLSHLEEVLGRLSPKSMIIANAFGSISIGHFPAYEVGLLTKTSPTQTSKLFNAHLKSYGLPESGDRLLE